MAMDNNVKLLPRTEQEKFQPKKLIRIKGNENNGNTFWFDRKLLAPCAWLDQMLMLSESESLAHNDPKQPLVLPTATSTSLFQFKQLLQDLYKFDNQVPQSTTSASNSENESTSSFISLLLHSIPFNFSSTKSNIPEDNNSKQDFTETVHQRWKSSHRPPQQHEVIDIIKTADLLNCEQIFKTALAWYEEQFVLYCDQQSRLETHEKNTNSTLDYYLRRNLLNHKVPKPEDPKVLWRLRAFLKERTSFEGQLKTRKFSANSSFAMLHKYNGTLQLWCPKTATLLNEFVEVKKFALSNNEQFLAIESCNELVVWDTQSNQCITRIPMPWENISKLSLNNDGSLLIIENGKKDTIQIWDLESTQCIKIIQLHKREFGAALGKYSIQKTYDCPNAMLAYISEKKPNKIKFFDCVNRTYTIQPITVPDSRYIYDFKLSEANHLAIFSAPLLPTQEGPKILELWNFKKKIFSKEFKKSRPQKPFFFEHNAEILIYFDNDIRYYFDIGAMTYLQYLSPRLNAARCYHRWYTTNESGRGVCSSDGVYYFNNRTLIKNFKKELSLAQLALLIQILEGKQLWYSVGNKTLEDKLYKSLPDYFKKKFHKQINTRALPLGISKPIKPRTARLFIERIVEDHLNMTAI
jgi:WD40 repeat protein